MAARMLAAVAHAVVHIIASPLSILSHCGPFVAHVVSSGHERDIGEGMRICFVM